MATANWIGFIFFVIGVGIASIVWTLLSIRFAWRSFSAEVGRKKLFPRVIAIIAVLAGLGGIAWALGLLVVMRVSL